MKITVRKAYEIDIPRLITLLLQVAKVHNDIRPDLFKSGSKKYNENDLKKLFCDEKVFIFVAVNERDMALGYIFCMLNEYKNHMIMQDSKTFYIDDLCVDETLRGSGIGKILYNHVCMFAKELGCYNITLNVWAGNDNARMFYENLSMKEQKRTLEMIL